MFRELEEAVSKTLDSTLITVLAVNGIAEPGKLRRKQQEELTNDLIVQNIDYTTYLPQSIPLTLKFMDEVIDPVTTAAIPTGVYRLTMRKLLRFSYAQLRRQLTLMGLAVEDEDEIGLAKIILQNSNETTPLIPEIARMLLEKELAYAFGVNFRIFTKSSRHPSATLEFNLKPIDLIQSLLLTRDDILAECTNQGLGLNRRENKTQLSVKLIAFWNSHPDQLREPFTDAFVRFLTQEKEIDHH